MMSLDILHSPGDEDESKGQSQHSSRAEPSLLPWSSTADLSEFWQSACNDTLDYDGLEASNDCSELGESNASGLYGEDDLSELPDRYLDIEEMESGDHNTVSTHGAFSSSPMRSQTTQGVSSMDASDATLELATGSTPYQEATHRPKEPFEEIGAQFTSGSLTDFERSPNHLNIQLPRVVVSNTAFDNDGNDMKCAVSETYADTSPITTHFDAEQVLAQNLQKLAASSGSSIQLPNVNWYLPSNYEVAMHDRHPPCAVTRGIEPQFGTLTTESVDAFYADADSIMAQVATLSNTEKSLGVKSHRPPKHLSTLQIPARTPPGWQHRRRPSGNVGNTETFSNSLQTTIYPTPPSSSYHQRDSAYGRDDPPSTPATPLCVSPTEPTSPLSPAPSLSDATDGITCCPSCPNKIFTGSSKDQKNSLQRHRRDSHKDLLRLPCLVQGCLVSFAPGRKDNQIRHVRAMHPYYPLPAPSTKRKRKADSDLGSS